jgi:hydroxymethylpyrimidine pyrophosphatase-like HAD family hydrolase
MRVAFDVDGTLITNNDTPRYEVIKLLFFFAAHNWDIYIWSGGGIDYANHWAEKLGLTNRCWVIEKGSRPVDIAVDDEIDHADAEGVNAKVVIKV